MENLCPQNSQEMSVSYDCPFLLKQIDVLKILVYMHCTSHEMMMMMMMKILHLAFPYTETKKQSVSRTKQGYSLRDECDFQLFRDIWDT